MIDIKVKYNIPTTAKIILYVGNISVNKNQQQLVRAFSLINEDLRLNTYVLFLGRYVENDSIVELINNTKFSDHLILCGNINREDVPSFYSQAYGVVLLSIAEGFGLSLIEGMHFGLPCMTFTDLDAFDDIYNPEVAVAVKDREDRSVAEGLDKLLMNQWNKKAIIDYSRNFDSNEMARRYIAFYKAPN